MLKLTRRPCGSRFMVRVDDVREVVENEGGALVFLAGEPSGRFVFETYDQVAAAIESGGAKVVTARTAVSA